MVLVVIICYDVKRLRTMSNTEIVKILRNVAAAYQILGENRFKIIAYERAAESIEQLTGDVKDYCVENKLNEIPGVGAGIAQVLGELLKNGHSKHIDEVLQKVPSPVFPLLGVAGIGPKRAFQLVTKLKFRNPETVLSDLEKAGTSHKIAAIEHFGEKSEEDILSALASFKKGQVKENRIELSLADTISLDVIHHLKKISDIVAIDVLGSLRRRVSTIGDIDIAVATNKPEEVIEHFTSYPHQKLIERGPSGATLLLHNGRQVDVRVQKPEKYGAMLQYFTGSKYHNIKLRSYGLTIGKSLNEHGIKDIKTGKMQFVGSEKEFYEKIGLSWIPPELREDKGEVEASLRSFQAKSDGLPVLIKLADIKGDLHIHTDYNLESSHDTGSNSLVECLNTAAALQYEYIGISDHNPSVANHTSSQIIDIMKRRKEIYEQLYDTWSKKVFDNHKINLNNTHLFIMCEIDIQPDGKLALPDGAFEHIDAAIVSIHSSFGQDRNSMTERVLRALSSHPKIRILGHPTGRLLTKRDGIELDWDRVFSLCLERNIALEINANPQRLDLPDTIVYEAVKGKIPLIINTDSHAMSQMELMKYGVSVARRGWSQKDDILNTLGYTQFREWMLNI